MIPNCNCFHIRFLLSLIGIALLTATSFAQHEQKSDAPRVFALDGDWLLQVRTLVEADDPQVAAAVKTLRTEADEALTSGPFSVVESGAVPPSGDLHDYMSVGPYWWPDPNKPDGLPYIRRDGEVNPDWHRCDRQPMGEMSSAVETLALAYFLTGEERYAKHAAMLLRTWFIDEDTRMNPNLNFGQGIPGRCEGRGIGLIDTARWVRLIDAIGLIGGWESWSDKDQAAMVSWFDDYLTWTLESRYGRDEARTRNNHATWYDAQVASYALFVGRDEVARRILDESARRRIASQIEPDGRQPHELARTKSWSYSSMNLTGMFELATLAQQIDVDLWNYRTEDGRGIRAAIDWLIPFATGEQPWKYKQITEQNFGGYVGLLRRASVAYNDKSYVEMIDKLPSISPSQSRAVLLYPAAGEH